MDVQRCYIENTYQEQKTITSSDLLVYCYSFFVVLLYRSPAKQQIRTVWYCWQCATFAGFWYACQGESSVGSLIYTGIRVRACDRPGQHRQKITGRRRQSSEGNLGSKQELIFNCSICACGPLQHLFSTNPSLRNTLFALRTTSRF